MEMYHYCNYDVFKSIIQTKKIWLTPVEAMNDSAEIIHLYENVWQKAKSILLNYYKDEWSVNVIEIVDREVNIIDKNIDKPYCCCMSDNGDLYQQWRLYADDGKGFSICFDTNCIGLKEILPHPNAIIENSIGVGTIIYNFQAQVNGLVHIASTFLNDKTNTALDWLNIKTNLRHYSAIFKREEFNIERERRIIYYYEKDHKFNNSFLSGPYDYKGKEFQRFDLNWYISDKNHSIKRIFIGPKNCITKDEVIKFLHKYNINLSKENIIKSVSTYR